jgi:light-regulated signal transduction histidine kinase (bacteriophytochrome)
MGCPPQPQCSHHHRQQPVHVANTSSAAAVMNLLPVMPHPSWSSAVIRPQDLNRRGGIIALGLPVKAKAGPNPRLTDSTPMATNPEPAAKPETEHPCPRLQRSDWLLAGYQMALGHELPNSLVSMQGLARLVLADQADRLDPDSRDLLERLADLAQRTDRMVRALAEVGRLERDPGPPEMVPLIDLVAEAVAEVKLLFNRPAIEYIIQQSMPTVLVARRGLYAVLQQLLRNAMRAVQANPAPRVEVGARPMADGLELWVADNGCGLSAAQQLHVFEAFQRDDASPGQGLGLFLVRQVVARWGGSVRVQSEAGKGATFTIRFP